MSADRHQGHSAQPGRCAAPFESVVGPSHWCNRRPLHGGDVCRCRCGHSWPSRLDWRHRAEPDPGFCPACGVGRFANEMGDDPDADVWPGTRMARNCPRCGSDQKPEEKPNDG